MKHIGTTPMVCGRSGKNGEQLCSYKGPMDTFEGSAGVSHKCPVCGLHDLNFNKSVGTAGNTRFQFAPYDKKKEN